MIQKCCSPESKRGSPLNRVRPFPSHQRNSKVDQCVRKRRATRVNEITEATTYSMAEFRERISCRACADDELYPVPGFLPPCSERGSGSRRPHTQLGRSFPMVAFRFRPPLSRSPLSRGYFHSLNPRCVIRLIFPPPHPFVSCGDVWRWGGRRGSLDTNGFITFPSKQYPRYSLRLNTI